MCFDSFVFARVSSQLLLYIIVHIVSIVCEEIIEIYQYISCICMNKKIVLLLLLVSL